MNSTYLAHRLFSGKHGLIIAGDEVPKAIAGSNKDMLWVHLTAKNFLERTQ
jgi:hypothetical protein